MEISKKLEIIGSVTGVLGALLLALNIAESGFGFYLFLVSTISLAVFAYKEQLSYLMTMQIVFTAINLLGVIRWS